MTRPISSLTKAYVFGSTLLTQLAAAEAQSEEKKEDSSSNLHMFVGLAFGGAALYLAYNVLGKKEEAPKFVNLDRAPRPSKEVMEAAESEEEEVAP